MDGFNTFEKQDKVLLGLNSGADAAAAYRILQQQGFAVLTFRRRYCRLPRRPATLLPLLAEQAAKLDCAFIATGHYARIEVDEGGVSHIITAVDAEADQSALLADLPQELLAKLVLPLGELQQGGCRRDRRCQSGITLLQKIKQSMQKSRCTATGASAFVLRLFFEERRKVEGGKVVGRGLGTANLLEGAVRFQQHLGAAQLAVVVVAHREAVGTGIVDKEDVALVDFRQHAVDGKLIVILAQAADHIVLVVTGSVLLAHAR